MKHSPKAEKMLARITGETVRLGDLRKLAREVKRDHALAWSFGLKQVVSRLYTPNYFPEFISIEVAKLNK